eukprot:Nitzschia sp. Nitz4//scaffold137_size62074//42716//43066//NITZ4_006423-RA/size62074-processed-gene-0.48-mRNA-1//-1//CDS//3329535724//2259//frame0
MLRKKQFGPGEVKPGGMRMPSRTVDTSAVDFDESLHTVDSINVHHRHVGEGDDDLGDFSVFSESFASTDTYDLSDYDDDGEGDIVREGEYEEESTDDHAVEPDELDNGEEDEPMKE